MTTSHISGIVPLLLITLICVGMVEGGYLLFEHILLDSRNGAEGGGADAKAKGSDAKATGQKKIDYRVILQRKLFGPPPGSNAQANLPVPDKSEALAATNPAIVLVGTVIGSEETERAIILDKNSNKQALYLKGDSVQGSLVKEIDRGKVILAKEGGDEILVTEQNPPTHSR